VRAEPRCQVGHRPKRAVVITALEADPTEGRVAGLDTDSEPELNPALLPHLRQFREPLLSGEGETDRVKLVLLDGEWIVSL